MIGIGIDFPDNPYTSYIYKAYEDGTVIWKYSATFDFDTLYDGQMQLGAVKELPTGDIIIAGYYAVNPLGSYYGIVSKVNSSGIPYWERTYTSNNNIYDDNTINTLALTNDVGFIVGGGGYSNVHEQDQNFWVLKLDSMGCLTPGCDTLDLAVMDLPFDNEIAVYPNPANAFFVIQSGENFTEDAEVQVINAAGEIVKKATLLKGTNSITLQTEYLQQGFYIVKLIDKRNRVAINKLIISR